MPKFQTDPLLVFLLVERSVNVSVRRSRIVVEQRVGPVRFA
jgi:hypothetical protein